MLIFFSSAAFDVAVLFDLGVEGIEKHHDVHGL